jgi:hypothetical protein
MKSLLLLKWRKHNTSYQKIIFCNHLNTWFKYIKFAIFSMKLCALCILISKKDNVTAIPNWCKPNINISLEQINMQRWFGGGQVTKNTITPGVLSRFKGKHITVFEPGFQIWSGMKRCDSCIQGLINQGATVQ